MSADYTLISLEERVDQILPRLSPNVVMVRGLGLFDAAEARGLFLRLGAAVQHAEKGN